MHFTCQRPPTEFIKRRTSNGSSWKRINGRSPPSAHGSEKTDISTPFETKIHNDIVSQRSHAKSSADDFDSGRNLIHRYHGNGQMSDAVLLHWVARKYCSKVAGYCSKVAFCCSKSASYCSKSASYCSK